MSNVAGIGRSGARNRASIALAALVVFAACDSEDQNMADSAMASNGPDTAMRADAAPPDAAQSDAAPHSADGGGDPGLLATHGTHNLLLIIADDVGVDNVSAYGEHADSAPTPNIDALAASGVLFRNAWANPMCSPSRASIYTGRHAYNHGVLHPAQARLAASEETFAEVLQRAGYQTALFGKWHLGLANGAAPVDHGFGFFAGAEDNLTNYFEWTKLTRGGPDGVDREETVAEYATTVNVDDAEAWIDAQANGGDPWMAVLAFNAPHAPYHVPPSDLYSHIALRGSPGDRCMGPGDPRADCYRAAAEAMDTKIGELVRFLDDRGVLDNTLIIFVGDNGTPGEVIIADGVFSPDHGKATPYEGGINVPLIAYGPAIGVRQGVEVSAQVMALDIFATFVEVGGGATGGQTIDAISLVDLLVGVSDTATRALLYSELFRSQEQIDQWTLTNGTAKYIHNSGSEECYDLTADPGETDNRYSAAGPPPVAATCDALKAARPCLTSGNCPSP